MILATAVASSGGAGCSGTIGGGGTSDTSGSGGAGGTGSDGAGAGDDGSGGTTDNAGTTPAKFTCDAAQKAPVDSLRALSTAQYRNTLTDLLAWTLKDPAAATSLLTEANATMSSLPGNVPVIPDGTFSSIFPDGGWLRADQTMQFIRVEAFYNIGIVLAEALTSSSNLSTVVGSCATDGNAANDGTCLTTFIQSFGARALRRPITTDDLTMYSAVYGTPTTASPAAYADVIAAMLSAPEMLYNVEHGDQPVAGLADVYTLSAYELASRLSYHVWDTMPDEELFAKAADGSLLTDATYQAEVDRLFADPRAKTSLDRFWADYMQTGDTGGPRGTGGLNFHDLTANVTAPVYAAFAGSDAPTAATYGNFSQDAVSFADYYTWTNPGTVHDLLTSNLSFAQTADLAKIYGVAAWDGKSAPPQLPAGQRPGLFTRALFVASGPATSPILKGVYLRRYVLCDVLGPPPPQAANAMVVNTGAETTRQATTDLTAGAPCNGCHTTVINPLGFVTESFDGLGRFRTAETLYNTDGSVKTSLPVNTAVAPQVNLGDTTTMVGGASDLMPLIEQSNKFGACMTRNYFRYVFARFEDLNLDGCTLETMRSKLDDNGKILDMLKAVVETPGFKQRTFS